MCLDISIAYFLCASFHIYLSPDIPLVVYLRCILCTSVTHFCPLLSLRTKFVMWMFSFKGWFSVVNWKPRVFYTSLCHLQLQSVIFQKCSVLAWYTLKRRGKWNRSSAKRVLNKFENVTFIFLPSCLCEDNECDIKLCVKCKQTVYRCHRNGLWYWLRRGRNIFLSVQQLRWLHFAMHETYSFCSSDQPSSIYRF